MGMEISHVDYSRHFMYHVYVHTKYIYEAKGGNRLGNTVFLMPEFKLLPLVYKACCPKIQRI